MNARDRNIVARLERVSEALEAGETDVARAIVGALTSELTPPPQKRHQCSGCPQWFALPGELDRHISIHHGFGEEAAA